MTRTAAKPSCRGAPKSRANIYEGITGKIVAAIETGAGEWRMPWHHNGTSTSRPINVVSRKPYRGVNVVALWVATQAAGYRRHTAEVLQTIPYVGLRARIGGTPETSTSASRLGAAGGHRGRARRADGRSETRRSWRSRQGSNLRPPA